MNSTLPPAGSEPPLLLQEVHAATPAGQAQLRGGLTTLSSVALELLIRVDGELTLEQISAGMPQVSPDAFMAALRELRDRGLVEPARSDPFTFDFQSFVDSEAMSQGGAEADSGLRSLTRAGYYVGIARPRPTARVRAPGTALWAVVVEDEPILARFIQSYLSFDGFKVRTAANRAEVIAEFGKRPLPDLVLLDVMLPDVDGFDVLRKLRHHKALHDVPVIMLTGKATREAVLQGIAGGADGYITKPFQPESLLRAVRTVLGLPEKGSADDANDPWTSRDALPPKPAR